jgi:hypothetical protein
MLAVGFALLGMSLVLVAFALVRHRGLRDQFLWLVPADLAGRDRRRVAEAIRIGRVPVNPELAHLTVDRARELVNNFPLRVRELRLLMPATALFCLGWFALAPRIGISALFTAVILSTWRLSRASRDRNNAQRILDSEHSVTH